MGYAYVEAGKIKSTLGGMPEPMVATIPPWSEKDRVGPWTTFWWRLRKDGGWSPGHIGEFAPLANAKDVSDAAVALSGVVSQQDAYTVANWLGGAVKASLPAWLPVKEPTLTGPELEANAYLNPQYLAAAGTNANVGDALLRLRAASPLVHFWAITKAQAKALGRVPAAIADMYQPLDKAVQKTAAAVGQAAESAVSLVDNAARGLGAGADFLGFVTRNAVPIALVGGSVYLWLRTRKVHGG